LSRATSVTDSMVEASSLGLADALTDEERSLGLLYPRIERSALPTIVFDL
jgi:malate dehydrogenase (oxaloacetate-decarboxylating)(NADP+)